ncbi:growth arrest-specific protein 1-like isoform X2 [Ctenocephalides felis]|nr:growth arrest-specific protein 1-like isoform X2 [Ctenocephalides felis]
MSCERARLDCAYRDGCAHALHLYMRHCDPRSLRRDADPHCPRECQYALIALTSTPEGKRLMTCVCDDNYCRESKLRLDVCRPHVARLGNATEVPCRLAAQICSADQQCYTALQYYQRLCGAMFAGRKCTARCRNSIAILRRQDNAARLAGCSCDGTEDFDCAGIQENMSRLCFHKHHKATSSSTTQVPETTYSRNDENNEIQALTSSCSNVYQTLSSVLTGLILLKFVER